MKNTFSGKNVSNGNSNNSGSTNLKSRSIPVLLGSVAILVLLASSGFVHAYVAFSNTQPCYQPPTYGANNDAIYDHIMNYHASTQNKSGVDITGMQIDYIPNASNPGHYYTQIDFIVSTTQTFTYSGFTGSNARGLCDAGSSGRGTGYFPITHVIWAGYNNLSQGGALQPTYANAFAVASPSGDPQVLQTVGTGATAPTGQGSECCSVNEAAGDNHAYDFVRVLSSSSNATGYNIVGINYYQIYSSGDAKYKFWIDLIIDSSSTYANSLPTGSHTQVLTLSSPAQQERWQIWDTNIKTTNQCNTRGFAYGTYQGLPLIEQSAYICV